MRLHFVKDTKSIITRTRVLSDASCTAVYTHLSGGPAAWSGVGGSGWRRDCCWSPLSWCSEYRKWWWRSCCGGPSPATRGGCCWTVARTEDEHCEALECCLWILTQWRSEKIGKFETLQITHSDWIETYSLLLVYYSCIKCFTRTVTWIIIKQCYMFLSRIDWLRIIKWSMQRKYKGEVWNKS